MPVIEQGKHPGEAVQPHDEIQASGGYPFHLRTGDVSILHRRVEERQDSHVGERNCTGKPRLRVARVGGKQCGDETA